MLNYFEEEIKKLEKDLIGGIQKCNNFIYRTFAI